MQNNTRQTEIKSGLIEADSLLDMFSDPRFDEAQSLCNKGQLSEAIEVYERVSISQAESYIQDAITLEQRNNVPEAIGMLQKCVALNPDNFTAWMKLANYLSGLEAENACYSALKVAPGNTEASLRLANLLLCRSRWKEATKVLAKAIQPANDSYDNQFGLASILWQLGDFSAAEQYLRQCIKINNEDFRPYELLLELFNRQDRVIDAEELCRDFINIKPSDYLIRSLLAQTLVRLQQWDNAETVFLELLNELPGAIPLRHLYADMLEKSDRAEYAIAILQTNVEMAPHDPEVYLPLADALHKIGQNDVALKTCNLAAKIYKNAENWGLHWLPGPLVARRIFYQLGAVAEKYCTGQRAFLDNTTLDIGSSNFEFGEVVELFCMVVGQEHIDYLEHVAYPALSSTEGFDQLLRERKVIYNIYTTPADFKLMQGFLDKLDLHGIRYRINVELLAFSQDLYSILVLPIIDQVKRSLALKSAVVMALPDAIISGSIYRVINDMKPFETVVCAMPRIDSAIAYPELREFFSIPENNGLDSRAFVRKSMTDFMHPQTYSALKSENNCLRYRDEGTYYSARNWAPPPLCFYAREEMIDHMVLNPLCGPHSLASFFAIDHDVVDSAYKTNNLRLISDSDYFFWAELTHPSRHTSFLEGRKSEDYYYPESSRHVFQHEFKWVYAG